MTRRTDGKTYALKKVDVSSLDDKELLSALNEIRLLASFAHPRIVRLYETFMGREGGREEWIKGRESLPCEGGMSVSICVCGLGACVLWSRAREVSSSPLLVSPTNHSIPSSLPPSDGNNLCIVMEYCGWGDLAMKIKRYIKRREYIDERVIWVYLIQILEGLKVRIIWLACVCACACACGCVTTALCVPPSLDFCMCIDERVIWVSTSSRF